MSYIYIYPFNHYLHKQYVHKLSDFEACRYSSGSLLGTQFHEDRSKLKLKLNNWEGSIPMTGIHTVTKKGKYGLLNSNSNNCSTTVIYCFMKKRIGSGWFRGVDTYPIFSTKCPSNSRQVCTTTSPIQVIIVLVT